MIRKLLDRRTFLNGVCATSGAALVQARGSAQAQNQRWRIWDVHCHMGRVPGDSRNSESSFWSDWPTAWESSG